VEARLPEGVGSISKSGIASTSPRPKSGVVWRRPTTFASTGSVSRQPGVVASDWKSEPPGRSKSFWPTSFWARVSLMGLAPPVAGEEWQTAQPVLLKIGPRRSSPVSTSANASLPSRKALAILKADSFERAAELEAARVGGGMAGGEGDERRRHERSDDEEGSGDSHVEAPCALFVSVVDARAGLERGAGAGSTYLAAPAVRVKSPRTARPAWDQKP
jgi:hypothetical protein